MIAGESVLWVGAGGPFLTPYEDGGSWVPNMVPGFASGASWGTQYKCVYVPLRAERRMLAQKLVCITSSPASGNVRMGLYDSQGNQLVTSADHTLGASDVRAIDITDTWFGPGLVYVALCNDTTTDTFFGCNLGAAYLTAALVGAVVETLGSLSLPATASWSYSSAPTNTPLIGVVMQDVTAT